MKTKRHAFSFNSEVGRDGALRRLCRRAQRQATERTVPDVMRLHGRFRPLRADGDSAARCPHHSRFPSLESAFSLLELLVVIATIAVLSSLLLPALSRARSVANRAKCTSNLRQLGLAAQMYFDDHDGCAFRYAEQALPNGAIYWFGWIENGADGSRNFDPSLGALYPYLGGRGVEICPSLNYSDPDFKLKAKGASYGYGYNRNLSAAPGAPLMNLSRITNSTQTVLFT